jgi:hypothetical protein
MNSAGPQDRSRRRFLQVGSALGVAFASGAGILGRAVPIAEAQSESATTDDGHRSAVPFDRGDTAVVFIDPQNEVLSENGAAWAAVGDSVKENKTIANMERIFQAAKQKGFEVFISPHYF